MKEQNAVIDALTRVVKGLLYVSETEAPMEPFLWEDEGLLKLPGIDENTSVEKSTLTDFFRAVSKEDKPKFDKLAKVLKEQLSGVKVYKIGDEAEKQVYVVGKTSDGKLAGIKTTVVET